MPNWLLPVSNKEAFYSVLLPRVGHYHMSVEVEVTPCEPFKGEEEFETCDRVFVLKNIPVENASFFEEFFKRAEREQNEIEEYVEKKGRVCLEALPIQAHKRVQTKEERAAKKSAYMRKRNRDPKVKADRMKNQQKPENVAKRQKLNQDPEYKKKKTFYSMRRRRMLDEVKETDPILWSRVKEKATNRVTMEMEEKRIALEQAAQEIERLEKELDMSVEQ